MYREAEAETIERGAALLDRYSPGWENRIDIERLDLRSSCDCVLGQLHGRYYFGLRALGISGYDYGFSLPPGVGLDEEQRYATLTAEWRRLIETRRS